MKNYFEKTVLSKKRITGSLLATVLLLGCRTLMPAKPGSQLNSYDIPKVAGVSDDAPLSGQYFGYINLKEIGLSVPISVELIAYRRTASLLKMRAVVKVTQGSFSGHEYFGYYFPFVDYNFKSKQIVFKSKDKTMAINHAKWTNDIIYGNLEIPSESLKASFFVRWKSGKERQILNQEMLAELPVAHPISGTYMANCKGQQRGLQLTLSQGLSTREEKLYDWQILGQWIEQDSSCLNKIPCRYTPTEVGQFSVGLRTLKLKGQISENICQQNKDGFKCGECQYNYQTAVSKQVSVSDYRIYNRKFHSLIHVKPNIQPVPGDIIGDYFGFIHNEVSNHYQLVKLSIASLKKTLKNKKTWDLLNGSATLFFENASSEEYIAYKFDLRRYVKDRNVFVFDGPGEAFFVVTGWKKEGIEGIWYSKRFGRIGTVEFKKYQVPLLSKTTPLIPSFSGVYQADDYRLFLSTRPNVSHTSNDFYPIKVQGVFQEGPNLSKKVAITNAKYDFYSGQVSIWLEDSRILQGTINKQGLSIHWPQDISFKKLPPLKKPPAGKSKS